MACVDCQRILISVRINSGSKQVDCMARLAFSMWHLFTQEGDGIHGICSFKLKLVYFLLVLHKLDQYECYSSCASCQYIGIYVSFPSSLPSNPQFNFLIKQSGI